MKAAVYTKYGTEEVLQIKELEKPVPKENEVLVKVFAVSINDWDWGLLTGTPLANRFINGLKKPKRKILGSDIAGVIETVGKNVKQFKPGDEVYGDLSNYWGGFAEYVCAPENALAISNSESTFKGLLQGVVNSLSLYTTGGLSITIALLFGKSMSVRFS